MAQEGPPRSPARPKKVPVRPKRVQRQRQRAPRAINMPPPERPPTGPLEAPPRKTVQEAPKRC
eukprot:5329647-Pyramimonas_sp.AAC.1